MLIVRPRYPLEAQRAGIQGCAVLQFDVTARGFPEHIRIKLSRPYQEFGRASRKALRQWRFEHTQAATTHGGYHDATRVFVFAMPQMGAAPTCGAGGRVIFAVARNITLHPIPISTAATPARSTQRPGYVPSELHLGITWPPITETYAGSQDSGPMPSGKVTLRFCVNDQGQTEKVVVARAGRHGWFENDAEQFIRAARFKPYDIAGWPVTVCGITETIVFKPAHSH